MEESSVVKVCNNGFHELIVGDILVSVKPIGNGGKYCICERSVLVFIAEAEGVNELCAGYVRNLNAYRSVNKRSQKVVELLRIFKILL